MAPNKFEEFLKNRKSLIDQYNKGDLTKEEFVEENYRCITSLGIKPFRRIDNVKKAIYNYQYYNVIAKHYQKRAHLARKNSDARNDYLERANYFYFKKDKVTERLLKIIDFMGVEAYYVKVKSPNLKKQLFEIVLKDYDNVILHSKNKDVLQLLIDENNFETKERESLIDSYINQKY